MADYYSQQVQDLQAAADICHRHVMTNQVNGIDLSNNYPRWPEAWSACEVVWRNYLDSQTMSGPNDEADRQTVIDEARRLRGL
jgi:hypothetical protein